MEKRHGVKMKYPVFLQALALTIVVFLIGMYSGVVLEENRLSEINDYYIDSEVSLLDVMALENLIGDISIDCEDLKKSNSDLLDRVYSEALLLEDYEKSGRVTNNLESFHKKYDVLRTHLWINSIKIKNVCGDDFNTVVYLYNDTIEDLTIKAEENVWSKVLRDLKILKGENIFLIPIDVGSDLVSLNSLIKDYEISRYPSVVVNEEHVISELVTIEELEGFLN